MTKLKLSYFRQNTRNQGPWKKTIMPGKIEGSRQVKRKTEYEMDWVHRRRHRHESAGAEQGAGEDRTVWSITHVIVGSIHST